MQEKQIIELIKNLSQSSLIGDDTAYLKKENLLVSCDALIEGIHFVSDIPAYYLGWKTAAINISDIAAMGGIAKYFLLSASLPANYDENWLKEFMRGLNECCEKYQISLIGGDLTRSDKIYLCGTILGESVKNKVALRSNAQIGHKVIVTGHFGSSAGGLYAWTNNLKDKFPNLIQAHFKPLPKITEGLNLLQTSKKPLSMMDSSDGLLDCLQQISEQSKVKIKINLNKIPIENNLLECSLLAKIDYLKWVLTGGEDYELVATVEENTAIDLQKWTIIGEVIEGKPSVEAYNENIFFDLDSLKIFQHFC